MSVEGNPVVDALPPETDYITYLTILEYQLTPERLPSLLEVLQDDALTENIGWDLVHLLVPMLPLSKPCLDLIARKGNPREVIIRVTEYLVSLSEDDDDDDLPTFEGEAERIHLGEMTLDGMPPSDKTIEPQLQHEKALPKGERQIHAFSALLSMLSILHPRIKSKHPSRFLATSLPAALTAYRKHVTHSTTSMFLDFLSGLSGRRKPILPPRVPSSDSSIPPTQVPLPDPEAEDVSNRVSDEERALIRRLLQAVALEICEDYVGSLGGDLPGLSWSSRIRESMFPEKIVPGKETITQRYKTEPDLQERDLTMRKITETYLLLGLHPTALIESLTKPSSISEDPTSEKSPSSPKEYPTDPDDIPFSTPGSLAFLAAFQMDANSDSSLQSAPLPLDMSKSLRNVNNSLIDQDSFLGQSDSVLDSLLAINLKQISIADHPLEFNDLEDFLAYVRPFIMLSADASNPELRYNSHLLATKALLQIPSDQMRLDAIKAFLAPRDLGPRLLIKGSAIGWLKNQILVAQSAQNSSSSETVFLQPTLIDELSADLFWDLSETGSIDEGSLVFNVAPTLSNITTALNFYYLLTSSPTLRETFRLSARDGSDDASSVTEKAITDFMTKVDQILKRLNTLNEEDKEGLHGDMMAIELCMDSIKSRGPVT